VNKYNKYSNYTKEELINELESLKKKKYGLVWDKKNTQELIDVFVNWESIPENFTPNKFPVLKELTSKEILTDKRKPINLLLEGDNYHSLAVLNFTHKNKIDVIYIDPPYNTGNKDFIFNDNYVDKEDPWRHSKYLTFMEKRLNLAKNLLRKNGVIFISIDDNEQAQVKLLCDEVFGENNFVTTIHVQMSTVSGQKVRAAKGGNVVKNAEYVLVYSKSGKKNIGKNLLYEPVEYDTHYSIFLTPVSKGIWKESSFIDECINNNKIFNLLSASGLASIKNGKKCFSIRNLQKAYASIEKFRDFVHNNAERIVRTDRMIEVESAKLEKNIKPNTTYTYLHNSGKSYLYGIDKKGNMKQRFLLSDKIREADDFYKTYGITNLRGDWWPGFHLDMGNVPKEGGVAFLNGKKPVRLIKQLINYCLGDDGTILDFFAGSGSTAQAVLELNEENNHKHKFILCTNNENNICEERTLPRIKNVIKGYGGRAGLGGNLKYFKTDFVGAQPTDRNKRDLVNNSSEMICMREDIFNLIKEQGLDYRIYNKEDKYLGIVFNEEAINDFKKEANKTTGQFIIYCFSYTGVSPDKEFEDMNNKHHIEPIPEIILKVYREIFKK